MKETKQVLVLERHIIKLYDESDYDLRSVDNLKKYDKIFISGDSKSLTSQIGIELFEDEKLISNCIIGSEGGVTGIHKNSALISYDSIVICCANTIFKLTVPNLNLEWKIISDSESCFGIYSLDKDYIVHGELEISRLGNNGRIIWQQSGRDIWTTAEGINDFAMHEKYILATDWEYNRYKYDFDGNLIEEYKVEPKA